MWSRLLNFNYDDYEIETPRKSVLENQVQQLLANFQDVIHSNLHAPLSTDCGVHIDGTEQQSDCELWHDLRRMRITGSTFKVRNHNKIGNILIFCVVLSINPSLPDWQIWLKFIYVLDILADYKYMQIQMHSMYVSRQID
jgi:hypothetical protein